MSELNETTRIINAENQEQLIKARDYEIQKISKLKFLLDLIKEPNALKEVEFSDKEGIETALRVLSFQNYLRLPDENECLMGLDSFKTIKITYTERKAIRNYFIRKVQKTCTPIVGFGQKIRKEFPELFLAKSNSAEDQNHSIRELEIKRRNLQIKLAEIRNRKCALLKAVAELKMGQYLSNELEITLAEHKKNQTKADVLQGYLVDKFFSQTDHAVKAIKEASSFVDAALEAEA